MSQFSVVKTVAVLFGTATVFALASETMSLSEADKILLGKSFVEKPWIAAPASTTARDGLGPLFNANSCISCHPKAARGLLSTQQGTLHQSVLFKLSLNQHKANNIAVIEEPTYGVQINTRANGTARPEAKPALRYQSRNVAYADGEHITLQQPIPQLNQLAYGALANEAVVSVRIAPSLFGLGQLARIPNDDIIENQRQQTNTSGRINWLWSPLTQGWVIGRFNHKASVATLYEQTAIAAFDDMGLTNPLFPTENCLPNTTCPLSNQIDLTDQRLQAMALYIAQLTLTKQTPPSALFAELGCADCHRPRYTLPNDTQIYPYTDLLLHDMGDGLTDGRSEFSASGSEWRTAPLWNLSTQQNFLHDGRARSIEEAIVWHGGEAQKSVNKFKQLSKQQRHNLLKFLHTL